MDSEDQLLHHELHLNVQSRRWKAVKDDVGFSITMDASGTLDTSKPRSTLRGETAKYETLLLLERFKPRISNGGTLRAPAEIDINRIR